MESTHDVEIWCVVRRREDVDAVTRWSRADYGATCDEATWPYLRNSIECGECKVLVSKDDAPHASCAAYCKAIGRECSSAWTPHNTKSCAVDVNF